MVFPRDISFTIPDCEIIDAMKKKHELKRVKQTFSIPLDVSNDLHSLVKKREMSNFVRKTLEKSIPPILRIFQADIPFFELANLKKVSSFSKMASPLEDGINDWQ